MTIQRLEVSNPEFTPNNTQMVTVHSSHLKRRHDINFYNVNASGQNLPVIILLHGVYGNSWVWMNLGGIDKAYEKVKAELNIPEFILAMPSDGGRLDGSAYLPSLETGNYEKWIVEDVMDACKQTLDSVTDNSHFYISGLSMGGYGALRLGAKYPNLFKGISAHSAITKLSDMEHFVETPLSEYQCEHSSEADVMYWLKQNQHQLPKIRFDCGQDDVLHDSNLQFEKQLKEAEIPYLFEQFPGGHEWAYWHLHVQKTVKFFADIEQSL